jgi:hypothetical protein
MAGKPRTVKQVVVRIRREDEPDESGRSRWLARWTANGARPSKPLPGRLTEDEATELAEDMQHRIRRGRQPFDELSSSWTVRDLVRFYLRDIGEQGAELRRLANDTDRLEQVVRVLGPIAADALDQGDLEEYVGKRRRDTGRVVKGRNIGGGKRRATPARSTVINEIRILLRAYRVARKRKRITCDPPPWPSFKGWPEDARPHRRLLESEVGRLVDHAESPELGRLFTFLAWCPRRPVAVFGIRRKDCSRVLDDRLPRKHRQLFVARDKGGVGQGWCPLTAPALEALVQQLESTSGDADDLVWTSETGRELTPALLWYPFHEAAERAAVADVQVYDLRRFGAVQVQAATMDLEVTCEYTGHEDVRTLLRYLSARRGVAEELAGSIGWSTPRLELVDEEAG